MIILYLDQFIVSDLADSQTEEYRNLKKLLIELVDSKEIICPLSLEHYLESASRSDEEALRNDELMNQLSGGKCFYPEFYITTFLINALLKGKPFTQEMYIEEAVKNVFKDKLKIEQYRNRNQKFRGSRENLLNTSNDIRKITRDHKIKNPTNHPLFKVTKRMSSISFTERMDDLFREGQIVIRGDKTPTGEIPNWIDIILEYLLRHFQITPPELINLYMEVKESGFENIPTLDILSTLNAFQCIYHKKMTPNDEIDNLRIACGLPISDILFTDKRRKSEIEQLKLDKKYQSKVLCGSKNDLEELKEILNEIKTVGNNA